jgi:hypothetical protein
LRLRRAGGGGQHLLWAAADFFGDLFGNLGRMVFGTVHANPDPEWRAICGYCVRSLLVLCLVSAVGAAEMELPAGRVKRSQGSVTVERAGQTRAVEVGTPVYVGDRVRTAADGAVGITLSDDTLLTAGPGSTLLINEFRFNTTTNDGNLLATLLKGTLSVVTGLIGKQAPQNVSFKTPTVVLGIRGTEFIIEARGDGE